MTSAYRMGVVAGTPWRSPDPREGKSQILRVWDVLFLGPFLIWAGTAGALGALARWILVISGGAVIAYNAANFARYARAAQA